MSRDGQWLSYTDVDPASGSDIWVVALDEKREPKAFVNSSASERSPTFSPDGRWLAYVSSQSGRSEIYVQPFPGPGGRITISTEGGTNPAWSRDGRELFYLNGSKMMAVTITSANSTLVAGRPSVLFDRSFEVPDYDVASDGRFLRVQPANPDQAPPHINVVLNWFEELKASVPSGR